MNSTTTTSSKEAAKANRPPETTPGLMMGSCTLKKARTGPAPKLAAASSSSRLKPAMAAVTVMTTKGAPSAAWERMMPV